MAGGGYTDDPAISDDAALWRRIHPKQWIIDHNRGGVLRPTSQAFTDSSDGTPMSVLLAEIVTASNRTSRDALVGYEDYALASITAGFAREWNQGITPAPEQYEPAHAFVFGQKTRALQRAFARTAAWVVPPIPPNSHS